jgi:hypothetical protein
MQKLKPSENGYVPYSDRQLSDWRAKKSRAWPGFTASVCSSLNETRRVGEGRLGILYIAKRLTNDLLGNASALAALAGDTRRFAYLAVAAAAFVDGIANLAVGDTLAKTDVHKHYP